MIGLGDHAVVFLTGALVYSNGVELALEVRGRTGPSNAVDIDPFSQRNSFALAVEFADGRRHVYGREATGPDSILLDFRGGRGDGASSSTQMFLTPVPPADYLLIYFEWPSLGISKTKTQVSTVGVRVAAAEVLAMNAATSSEGTESVLTPTPPPVTATATAAVDVHLLRHLFSSEVTALVRTDFSDDGAWSAVVDRLIRPVDFDDPERDFKTQTVDESELGSDEFLEALEPADDDYDHLYQPNVATIDNPANAGLTAEQLAHLFAADEDRVGYVLLADERSMREARTGKELTAVYVDVSWDSEFQESEPGQAFRVTDREFASVEVNLAIANLSFSDFAHRVDPDGVYRGSTET